MNYAKKHSFYVIIALVDMDIHVYDNKEINHGHYPEYNATCMFIIWKLLSSSPVLDQSYAFVATCSLILKDMVEWITWIC